MGGDAAVASAPMARKALEHVHRALPDVRGDGAFRQLVEPARIATIARAVARAAQDLQRGPMSQIRR